MSNARLAAVIAIVALVGWLFYQLAPMLTPFLAAGLLAYIGNPAVTKLQRHRVPRVLGVILVFCAFIGAFVGLVFFLVPLLSDSLSSFFQRVPEYYDWALAQIPRLETWLGVKFKIAPSGMRDMLQNHWKDVGDWATKALGAAKKSGLTLISWAVNLLVIPVVTFYLLLDWNLIVARIDALLPPRAQPKVRQLARETDMVLGSFFRGQLLVMASLAAIYSIGLWLVGLDLALPIGLLAGTLSFVPYLGFVIGIVSASVSAYLQFQDVIAVLWVVLVFGVGQLLEGTILTPRLVGRRIGLHPVAVIFAVMAGGQLFGFFGVLLALPAAAAIKVWLNHAHEAWMRAPTPVRRRRS